MPLGGGTFTQQNKTLPGAYINFVVPGGRSSLSGPGIAALPFVMSWGKPGVLIKIYPEDFAASAPSLLGYEADAPQLAPLREAFKKAGCLLIYRAGGGEAATAEIEGLQCTAACPGSRGNDLAVSIQTSLDLKGQFEVITLLDHQPVDRQLVKTADQLKDNPFLSFSGDTLTSCSALPLSSGRDAAPTGADYARFLELLETEELDTLGYPGQDESTKKLFSAFTIRQNEQEGKKFQCVLADAPMDHESIVNVKNGVVLEDGTTLSPTEVVPWVTAASAGAGLGRSLTNCAYEGAVDVFPRLSKRQHEEALLAGEFTFYNDGGVARVTSDINSLVTLFPNKTPDLRQNRVLRVMNSWSRDIAFIFGRYYLGKMTNNDTGRQLFKADLLSLAARYIEADALSGFQPEDLIVEQGANKREVVVKNSLQPADSMEILYMTTTVM